MRLNGRAGFSGARLGMMAEPPAPSTVVSIGYEQRTIEDLVELLQSHGVAVLVDVRLNPISRKKGFSKKALASALIDAGIEYRHERDLGNPKDNREPFRRGLRSARDRYINHILNGTAAVYTDIIELALSTRIALLCYERNHNSCHRSCILESAQNEYPDLYILEL